MLIEEGVSVGDIASLVNLVTAKGFKTILRRYHNKAGGKPNAFLQSLAGTLIQVAKFHLGMAADDVDQLKRIATKPPAVPFDLTSKNKALLRELESDRLRGKLIFLPEQLF